MACCKTPHLEITLEGPLDLLGGSTASQRGLTHGSTGLPSLPVQVTTWLVEHDAVLLTGNGDEGLWVTGPGDPKRTELGAGGSAEASPESWGQTSQAAGFWSSSWGIPQTNHSILVFPRCMSSQLQEGHTSACVQPKWVPWHRGEGHLRPPHHTSMSHVTIHPMAQAARMGHGGG